jgi:hypothetical protein
MILLVQYLLYLNTNKTQVIINILKNTEQTKQNIFLRIQNKTKYFMTMLNISLVFQKYLYSFYTQQSNKFLPCFAFTSIKTLSKNG